MLLGFNGRKALDLRQRKRRLTTFVVRKKRKLYSFTIPGKSRSGVPRPGSDTLAVQSARQGRSDLNPFACLPRLVPRVRGRQWCAKEYMQDNQPPNGRFLSIGVAPRR